MIVAGTRRGGVVLLGPSGDVQRIITKSEGLPGDYITALQTDRQGGIWLAEFNGIARVSPALSHFGPSLGLEGNMLDVTRQGGTMFAGTTAGLFQMYATTGETPRFQKIDGIGQAVWSLAPYPDGLLFGAADGVYQVSGHRAVKILDKTQIVYEATVSPTDGHVVYAAARLGVFLLRKSGRGWINASTVSSAGDEFRTVAEESDGKVWATTTRSGIWHIDFTKTPAETEKFGADQGVPTGWVYAWPFHGHVVFATEKGLMRWSEAKRRLEPDAELGTMFSDGSHGVSILREDASGNVWISGDGYHGLLKKKGAGYDFQPMPLLHSGIKETYSLFPDKDGVVWASGSDYVLYRWDPASSGNPSAEFHLLPRRVGVLGASDSLFGGSGKFPALKLPWRNNALRFEFAAPFYEEPGAVEYQIRLNGNDKQWSEWTHDARKEYTYLPEGGYKFHVRARNPHGQATEEAVLPFAIEPPWYRTLWAYGVYFIFLSAGVWGIVRLRVRQLEARNAALEVTIEERTVEIREQRDEIQRQEKKTHSLLLNILPEQVAEELRSTGAVKPVGFDDVTVCFTDFAGFTLSSEKMPPEKLVAALNDYFTAFDEIIARYGLEKLKTIGDSYMFVSGLPKPKASHAVDAVLAALEMAETVKELSARDNSVGWRIRIGLNSGPVVAGVVGTRKFAFDIWGDTVNFAARMESSGVAGQVNLSESTRVATHGLIECKPRGLVKIKEGREMQMYLAEDIAGDEETFRRRYREQFGEDPKAVPLVRAIAETRS